MKPRTRLAPTPSGALHAGNAFSFLLAWLHARTRGGTVVLRVEDVDTTRARPGWVEGLFRDLEWMGLDWDLGPAGPTDLESEFRQSSRRRQERYEEITSAWTTQGRMYPCGCSRNQLRLDAPQVERIGQEMAPVPYGGRCRSRSRVQATERDAWRLRLPSEAETTFDLWDGPRRCQDLASLGDPVLRRSDGVFAYHLAVCADDADQAIDLVVRGRDLLPYAPLHAHLHRLLGHEPPRFVHHGLLGDPQGNRLAKRIGSGSLESMRRSGMDPRVLVGDLGALIHPSHLRPGDRIDPAGLADFPPPGPLSDDAPCPSFQGDHP